MLNLSAQMQNVHTEGKTFTYMVFLSLSPTISTLAVLLQDTDRSVQFNFIVIILAFSTACSSSLLLVDAVMCVILEKLECKQNEL